MRTPITNHLQRLLLALILGTPALRAADWLPVRAQVSRVNGAVQELFVRSASIKEVVAAQDKDGVGGNLQLQWREISAIDYVDLNLMPEYVKPLGDLNRGNYERSLKGFEANLTVRKQVLQIRSLERIADLYVAQQKLEDAAATLQRILTDHPLWPENVAIAYRRGEILVQAKKFNEADAAFADLANMAAAFGPAAASSALLGQAEAATARGDNAKAATLLAQSFAGIKADEDPVLRGRIGLRLAQAQTAAKQQDAAISTLRSIMFLPLSPDDTSRVHAAVAEALRASGDLATAFDHAAMAAVVRDASSEVRGVGVGLARAIARDLEKDAAVSLSDKIAYRDAAAKL